MLCLQSVPLRQAAIVLTADPRACVVGHWGDLKYGLGRAWRAGSRLPEGGVGRQRPVRYCAPAPAGVRLVVDWPRAGRGAMVVQVVMAAGSRPTMDPCREDLPPMPSRAGA